MKIFTLVFIMLIGNALYADNITKPFLYEIKNTSDHKVAGYLFGTMHAFVNAEDLPVWFWRYFDQADGYAFESLDGTDPGPIRKFKEEQSGRKPGTKSLHYILSDKEKEALDRYLDTLEKAGKKKFLETTSAFGAIRHINGILDDLEAWEHDANSEGATQLDSQLEKRVGVKKPRFALDEQTAEYFKCVFETDETVSIKNLKILLSRDYKRALLERKKGVNPRLSTYVDPDKKVEDDLWWPQLGNWDCIGSGRNKLWMPKILNILRAHKTAFISVGVAHLNGKEPTVISLLEKEGFEIKRLREP